MEASISNRSALEHWLRVDPAGELGDEARAIWVHAEVFQDAPSSEGVSVELLGLFCDRVLDVDGRLRGALLEARLPLPEDLRSWLGMVVDSAVRLAQVSQRLARKGQLAECRLADNASGRALPRALGMSMAQVAGVLSAMGGLSPPFNFWATAHALARGPGPVSDAADAEDLERPADTAYKSLLALAVVQPEGLSPREIQWLVEFLDRHASELCLAPLHDEPGEGFWIDGAQDVPPVAISRRPPPVVDGVLKMDARPLAARAAEGLARLQEIPEEEVTDVFDAVTALTVGAALPEGLTVGDAMAVLDRVARYWSAAPLRERPRRWQQQPVTVCFGLSAIWECLRGGLGASDAQMEEWVVVNESIGGYAILGQQKEPSCLAAGMVVAVRLTEAVGWTVCIVRWIRAEDPARIELGLQVVADGATPVRLGFRGGETREMLPGLMLSPRVGMRGLSGMLVPAGTSVGRRFVFVRDGSPLYVGQGLLVSVEIRTANSELFQFELDPIPE